MIIDFKGESRELKHTWSKCVGAGRANEGLRADWQNHLKMVIKDCGFKYLRFHGLLHDDMHVYTETDGVPHYNFQYVDKVFDYMLDSGIRPIVEFGFMPKALASNDSTIFWWKGNVAPPNNYDKWAELLAELVKHWISRYGTEEVEKWYFEIWNEPNLSAFWAGTKSQYFELYKVSVRKMKEINSKLRVGGPATSNYVPDERFHGEVEDVAAQATFKTDDIDAFSWEGVWIKDFLEYCDKEQLPIDFISTHPYPTDFALDGHGQSSGKTRYKDSLYDDIMWLRKVIADSKYKDVEIHLTEWSSSPTSRDCSHDYLPAATYVMRSNLRCAGLVDSLSYWVFTDVFEEVGAGPAAFHGGFGMINLQGAKKPVYHAYRILNQLGHEELESGEGYIFTRKNEELVAAFYNYPSEYKGTVPMSTYPDQSIAIECQNSGKVREYDFTVSGLCPLEEYQLRILRKEDIAVQLWNDMGRPHAPNREQEKRLITQGDVFEVINVQVDEEGKMVLHMELEPWSIAELVKK